MDNPGIYVADLAAYNGGDLVGKWFDLTEYGDADELTEAVQEQVLLPGNEEWAIHDYEGFGPIRVGEYDQFATIMQHVENMGDEPRKYWAWIDATNGDPEDYDADNVNGPSESESDYADQRLESFHGSTDLQDILVHHGLSAGIAESIAEFFTQRDPESVVRDWSAGAVTLVRIEFADYSSEYYEVAS